MRDQSQCLSASRSLLHPAAQWCRDQYQQPAFSAEQLVLLAARQAGRCAARNVGRRLSLITTALASSAVRADALLVLAAAGIYAVLTDC